MVNCYFDFVFENLFSFFSKEFLFFIIFFIGVELEDLDWVFKCGERVR